MLSYQQKAPGVYREDLFPTPAPVLLTGVPVFLGFAEKGPENTPQRLTLWPQFVESFGEKLADGYLASAVHGFFSNGGRFCYGLRLLTMDALEQGLEAVEPFGDIDLVCAPDLARDIVRLQETDPLRRAQVLEGLVQKLSLQQQLILEHCDQMGNRFAILDAQPIASSTDLPKILEQRRKLKGINGALYAPWLKTEEGSLVPPCGHVAGTYARGDRDIGVHQAPANMVLEDVLDLSPNLSNADWVALNLQAEVAGVNCLRALPGRGFRVWGARTLSQNMAWRYINARRLLLTVGRWVELNLADVAFEPNEFSLWVRIERELTAYLESLAQQGALKGRVPEEAFYIKCDAETNPPEVREAGQIVTEIGLAPTTPNEFIVVRLIHGDSGVTLSSSAPP